MDLLVFSGQSNMQGQTEAKPFSHRVGHAYEYRMLSDRLVPLRHPVGENIGDLLLAAHEGHGSLVPSFCRVYVRKTGRDAVAVHAAKGATTIAEWLPSHPSGRYELLIRKIQGACSAAKFQKGKDRLFFIWLQGESDAIANCSAKDYRDKMILFREALEQEVPLDQFCLIRVGKFVRDHRDLEIIRAQETLCQKDGFLMLTRCTGFCTEYPEKWINPQAEGHYNNAAMTRIGTRAGEQLSRFVRGARLLPEREPYGELV